MRTHFLRNTGTFVGDDDGRGSAAAGKGDGHIPAGRSSLDGVLHEIGGDEAQQTAAVAFDTAVEAALDEKLDSLLSGWREIAPADRIGEFMAGELIGSVRG